MITSASNTRIKDARKLQRRRERYEQGQLLIEGARLVRDAWQQGATFHHAFVAPELIVDQKATLSLIDELKAEGIELLSCTGNVFATLSETVTPQGIAAVVAMPHLPLPDVRTLTLLLDQVRDPGNAGTLLRSAAAAGVQLALFGPETVDPFNEKVLRAGMGAHFRVPIRVLEKWDEAAALIDLTQPLYVADAGSESDYDRVDWSAPCTLAVGGEANGASAWVREHALAITIPMLGATESLNAAVAGSVILFEAARQRRNRALHVDS
jgi:TrmH family RNA methyltransferase